MRTEKHGEVSEWSNVPAWKASIVKAIGGSNPLLSAKIPLSTSVGRGIFVKLKGEDSKGAPPKAEKVACGKFLATDRSVLQSIGLRFRNLLCKMQEKSSPLRQKGNRQTARSPSACLHSYPVESQKNGYYFPILSLKYPKSRLRRKSP